jgi:hypothetical protein
VHQIDFFVPGRRRKWYVEEELSIAAHELRALVRREIGDEVGTRLGDDEWRMTAIARGKCDEAEYREGLHRLTRIVLQNVAK